MESSDRAGGTRKGAYKNLRLDFAEVVTPRPSPMAISGVEAPMPLQKLIEFMPLDMQLVRPSGHAHAIGVQDCA